MGLMTDGYPRITPSFQRDRTNYRCRPCNVRGHSERWAKCPSRLAAAANSTKLRDPVLPLRQDSLSNLMPGTPRGLDPPGPPSALSDITSLPVPFASTGQCLALSTLAGCSLPSALPEPGPESVPVPGPEHDLDPPTGDPPNLTTVLNAQCDSPTPDVASSHTPSPAEDDPLAGLDAFSGHQELSARTQTLVPSHDGSSQEPGSRRPQPVALEAAPDPAPDGTPGRSPELVPSSPPRNGRARPWRPPKKKKKGRKKLTQ
ncbi:nematocyst expressed protein 3-like [Macrobrachium rosenbergii]|uniref:nematocyst expressed protein 3-like n=1 Tax=Macrobrachium rosenbergii TaxID=79674 RepID=UPI0034D746A9